MTWQGGFANPTVGAAQIQDGSITSVKLANTIQSDNWDGTTVLAEDATLGWRIELDTGNASFNNLVLRGSISGSFVGEWSLDGQGLSLIPNNAQYGSMYMGIDEHYAGVPQTATGCFIFSGPSGNNSVRLHLLGGIEAGNTTGTTTIGSGNVLIEGGDAPSAASGNLLIEVGAGLSWVTTHADNEIRGSGVGISNPGGRLSFIVGTSEKFRIDSSYFYSNVTGAAAISQAAGSAASPAYTFTNDTNLGIYRYGSDILGFSTGGTAQWYINSVGSFTYLGSFSAANIVIDLGQSYRLYSDNTGPGSANTRVWLNTPDGAGLYFGPRSGSSYIGYTAFRSNQFDILSSSGVAGRFAPNGANSTFWLLDGLTNVGNHETLRLDRGSGTILRAVGYYSSALADKKQVTPIAKSKLWQRKWFMDLEPITYRRRTKPYGREYGFYLENLGKHTNQLTTKGDKAGASPDEFALLSVTVDYVQHLEKRLAALERAA